LGQPNTVRVTAAVRAAHQQGVSVYVIAGFRNADEPQPAAARPAGVRPSAPEL